MKRAWERASWTRYDTPCPYRFVVWDARWGLVMEGHGQTRARKVIRRVKSERVLEGMGRGPQDGRGWIDEGAGEDERQARLECW